MKIVVNLRDEAVVPALLEPDDFGGFEVRAIGSPSADLSEAISPVGEMADEEHAWIRIDAVKRLAGRRADDAGWLASLQAMLAYATDRGWVNEDRSAIRAHCVRETEGP